MNNASEEIQPVLPAYHEVTPVCSALSSANAAKDDDSKQVETPPGYLSVNSLLPEEVLQVALLDIEGQTSPKHSEYYVPLASRQPLEAAALYKYTLSELDKPIYQRRRPYHPRDDPHHHGVIKAFFDAVRNGSTGLVSLFLLHDLLDANTPGTGLDYGTTPLIHAVHHKQRAIVELLIAHGANVNSFGIVYPTNVGALSQHAGDYHDKASVRPRVRTSLQVACAGGDLAMVKLLHDRSGADDTLVAPDGQIALRLASSGKHKEIVAYLPARRGGAFKRIQAKSRRLIRRVKRSAVDVFDLLKTVFYTVPKWLVKCFYELLRDGAMYCWKHRKEFVPGCVKWVKRLGRAIVRLPRGVWELCIELFKLTIKVTKRIPRALLVFANFVGKAAQTIGKALWWIANRAASAVYTAFAFVIMKIRGLTWNDMRRGFVELLKAIFVSLPQALWEALQRVVRGLKGGFVALFGCIGEIVWHIPKLFISLIQFILKPIWRSIQAVVGTLGAAGKEVKFFFNPKG